MASNSIDVYLPNGDRVASKPGCSIHHEASYNHYKVGDFKPFELLTTLGNSAIHQFGNFTQTDDTIIIWDTTSPTNNLQVMGDLHTGFGVPFELRNDTLSNSGDPFSDACAWAPNATTIKQDWSHGNALHYGSKYLIFNPRHMESTILLFNHEATEIMYYVGGSLSDFTFLSEDAKWYAGHDTQETYSKGKKLRLLIYDNGVNRPVPTPFSRGVEIELNFHDMTIKKHMEFIYEYAPGLRCYSPVIGGITRLKNGNTLVNFPFCNGDNATVDGHYAYMVEYDPSGVLIAVTKVDVDSPQPTPARGIYRTRVIESIANEEVDD